MNTGTKRGKIGMATLDQLRPTVGAAAIGGGIAWWVVGAKRRRPAPTIALRPTGIDLRLRF